MQAAHPSNNHKSGVSGRTSGRGLKSHQSNMRVPQVWTFRPGIQPIPTGDE